MTAIMPPKGQQEASTAAIKATAQELNGSKQEKTYFTYKGETYPCPDTGAWLRTNSADYIKQNGLKPVSHGPKPAP